MPDYLYFNAFHAEHCTLFQSVMQDTCWNTRMRSRATASFGIPYNYNGMTYARTGMPSTLREIARQVSPYIGANANSCLANLYSDGDARLGFHVDNAEGLVAGTGIAILSLGATRTMLFQSIEDCDRHVRQELAPGSLLVLTPALQRMWKHSIPHAPLAGPRISLSFRALTT